MKTWKCLIGLHDWHYNIKEFIHFDTYKKCRRCGLEVGSLE